MSQATFEDVRRSSGCMHCRPTATTLEQAVAGKIGRCTLHWRDAYEQECATCPDRRPRA